MSEYSLSVYGKVAMRDRNKRVYFLFCEYHYPRTPKSDKSVYTAITERGVLEWMAIAFEVHDPSTNNASKVDLPHTLCRKDARILSQQYARAATPRIR